MNKRLVALAATGVVAVVAAYLVLPDRGGGSGCAPLEVNTSVETGKIEAIQALAKEYNASGRRAGEHCVEISVHATSSGRAKQALSEEWTTPVEGAPKPDVWLPTTSLWVELLVHEGKLDGMPTPLPSIAQSPLAIAMPEKMARAMGWPATQVSWREILKRSEEPTGWAQHGHPEWGRFGFGKDNPRKSSSGLAATVATYYAATGKSSDLRVADIDDKNVAAFVLGVEAGVHHYDDDATKFLRTLGQYDEAGKALTYVSAIPLEEQLIYEYNLGGYTGGRKPTEPLVALYPTDGTFMLDHPYVIMPELDQARKAGAADFLAYLLERQPLADKGFRLPSEDKAELKHEIPGMLKLIDQNSVRHTPSGAVIDRMLQAWDTMRKQADILFIIDVSGSMEETVPDGRQRMQVVQDVLIAGIDNLPPVHNVALWTFSDGINHVLPLRSVADTRQQLRNTITSLEPKGATALYRAVREGHRDMAARVSKDRITAVIVLTDGKNEDTLDNNLPRLLADIDSITLEAAGRPSVRVFSVAFSGDANFADMKQISERTRGRAYDATENDLNKIFVDVISNF
ncbi:vWA domain-containing protein [Allorhizocola rhizosphaerae]|uniref:vWA domain-containing protein n=1 Tax=Allorhizocola rhizosphaerae TaxID=1872709 RepID=UPI000E3C4E7F|nr:VWA domain-containing protein [Allorhizocola rhizosphaerae]